MTKMIGMAAFLFAFAMSAPVLAHHNSPEEIYDFISEQLVETDSPHLTTSEEDPSLLTLFPSMEDVDDVFILYEVDLVDVIDLVTSVLDALGAENEVCDYAMVIEADDRGTYTVTVGIDFCAF
jgi:hypothetical protein